MPQYLVAVYLPDNYDPSTESEETMEAIHALNREMIDADVRKLACGLSHRTTTVRVLFFGVVFVFVGLFLVVLVFVGGFWILETANLEEALAWARKGASVCRASGEVREMFFRPAPVES